MVGNSLSRRDLLRVSGLSCAATLLGCGGRTALISVRPEGTPGPRRRLAPVLVSSERIIRRVVGLRPFRPAGFVVRAETLGDKLLVHNYGHGGCGVTLSWGTSHLALEEVAKSGREGPAAVIGCGAVGLATARLLQKRGFQVTIYARELPPDTTSNVAGASWYPSLFVDEAFRTPAFDAQFEKAARFSHRYFQGLVGERYGVHWREQYYLSDAPAVDPWEYTLLRDLFPETRRLSPAQHQFASPYVLIDNMMFIEPPVYLDTLLRDFRLANGSVQIRAFAAPSEVAELREKIVINCTGLGARELFGDHDLVGIKGQLSILLPQPDVDYAMTTNELYMFPRRDGILLGGTSERGVENLELDLAAEERIIEGHKTIFEGMQ